jgi:hypothetical protein
MGDGWFKLNSGRSVLLQQFHVRATALEILEGSADWIRTEVLRKLPVEVSKRYGNTGLLLRAPAAGPLPGYTFFADLYSYEPIQPGFECSRLVVCWFGDNLPESVRSAVASQLETLDWNIYAKDGRY